MIKKKNSLKVLVALGLLMGFSSCSKDEDNIDTDITTVETENQSFLINPNTGEENRAPVANRDFQTHFLGDTIVYDVLANDTDPDGDELTVINVFTNDNPNIVWDGGNTIEVTRTSRFQSQVWYEISDGNGGTSFSFIVLFNSLGNNG